MLTMTCQERAWAFIDESRRGSRVLCVAARVPERDHEAVRAQITRLTLPGQRRLHFVKERDSRRRQILAQMTSLPLQVSVRRCRVLPSLDEQTARLGCLLALLDHPCLVGAVIESRDAVLDARDRRAIGRRLIRYRHATPYEEPLLWLPDAIAWAVGKGGEWLGRFPEDWKNDDRDLSR